MVTRQRNATVWTRMPANGQAFLDGHTAARAYLARIGRGHGYGSLSSILSFESEDGAELTPACIIDALGKVFVLRHVGNLQGLKVHGIVLREQGTGGFMLEVPARSCDLLILFPQEQDSLALAFAALLAPILPALRSRQCPFCLAILARVGNLLAIRQRQKEFQP